MGLVHASVSPSAVGLIRPLPSRDAVRTVFYTRGTQPVLQKAYVVTSTAAPPLYSAEPAPLGNLFHQAGRRRDA